MSIKIGSEAKNVVDVVFGTSSSDKKNVDVVKDWNGNIIWQRDSRIMLTDSNTSFSYKNSWSSTSSAGYYEPTPKPYASYEGDGTIYYTGGPSPIPLYEGTDYTVSWSNNRVESTSGTETGTGTMHINGAGNYSGTVNRTFYISYTYQAGETTWWLSAVVSPAGSGTVSGAGKWVKPGATCSLSATPAAMTYAKIYSFKKWEDESKSANRTITMPNTNKEVTAYFNVVDRVAPSITSITSNQPSYTVYHTTTHKPLSPAYTVWDNPLSYFTSGGFTIGFSDGTSFSWSSSNKRGITISIGNVGSQIALNPTATIGGVKYTYAKSATIYANGDGTWYKTDFGSTECYLLKQSTGAV